MTSPTQWRGGVLGLVLLLLFAARPALSGYSWGTPSRDWREPQDDSPPPEFRPADASVTALLGETAYLPCEVANLGDRVVSWIRSRDLHILTSGALTYTSDSRFAVLHPQGSDSWTLRILGAQARDEGQYECQVNTDPKINFAVFLSVRENNMGDSPYDGELNIVESSETDSPPATMATTAATITGRPEQHVHAGSTVTFTCLVTAPYAAERPPRDVDWFHGRRPVSIQAARGGISLVTEKTELQTTSRLTVAGVTQSDAGNYTCRPSDTRPATVLLVVVPGEHSEAMQRDGESSTAARRRTSLPNHVALGVASAWWCVCHASGQWP
ncbi:protein CEPU-1-like [Bacillus rossius redtenbacheri]|uniref:protein CEPU-1-like n=1 Tax=Bacillus rossius redtenbacheri TaxID=93214 RepID=UPI002FDCB9C8